MDSVLGFPTPPSLPPYLPPSPPIPTPPTESVVSYYYWLKQTCGAILVAIGVGISVFGLHGIKLHGQSGTVSRCNKPRRWCGYAALWAFGQVLQLLAVQLAEEPVVAATCNFAVIVNAFLAYRLLGEPITPTDCWCICAMMIGACLVVVFVPPAQQSLSTREFEQLFERSATPAAGIGATTMIAVLSFPRTVQSFWSSPASRAVGGASGAVAFGLLAGWSGATSMTAAKVCAQAPRAAARAQTAQASDGARARAALGGHRRRR